MTTLRIETPRVFLPLLEPAPYKGAYGGRGSGKSHFFAEKLVEDHLAEPGLRSVSIREVQKSLKDSSKLLIEDKLAKLGLGAAHGFKVWKELIETPGDGVIIFQGMQDHTAESIKSLEGFKRAWIEEAQTISERSLTLLRPTIREEGSEIWASWNARRKTDAIDALLRGPKPPPGAVVVKANWRDNPFFTDKLEAERAYDEEVYPDRYAHVWEGEYVTAIEGAYFAKPLAKARSEGRIASVAADPLMSFRAYWDIGGTGAKADATAIWIVQFIGTQIRLLRYYEAVGQPLAVHLAWLRSNGFDSALCVLPHDGAAHDKIVRTTYEGSIREAGFNVRVVPNQGAGAAMQRVEAARRLFPSMHFDEAGCQGGLDALGWYHERRDDVRKIGLGPEHDWSSHGADAFGLMAIDYEAPKQVQQISYSNRGIA